MSVRGKKVKMIFYEEKRSSSRNAGGKLLNCSRDIKRKFGGLWWSMLWPSVSSIKPLITCQCSPFNEDYSLLTDLLRSPDQFSFCFMCIELVCLYKMYLQVAENIDLRGSIKVLLAVMLFLFLDFNVTLLEFKKPTLFWLVKLQKARVPSNPWQARRYVM